MYILQIAWNACVAMPYFPAFFCVCIDGIDSTEEIITEHLKQAAAAGGQGTPYFVAYNKKTGDKVPVSGAVPYAQIESALQSVL